MALTGSPPRQRGIREVTSPWASVISATVLLTAVDPLLLRAYHRVNDLTLRLGWEDRCRLGVQTVAAHIHRKLEVEVLRRGEAHQIHLEVCIDCT